MKMKIARKVIEFLTNCTNISSTSKALFEGRGNVKAYQYQSLSTPCVCVCALNQVVTMEIISLWPTLSFLSPSLSLSHCRAFSCNFFHHLSSSSSYFSIITLCNHQQTTFFIFLLLFFLFFLVFQWELERCFLYEKAHLFFSVLVNKEELLKWYFLLFFMGWKMIFQN